MNRAILFDEMRRRFHAAPQFLWAKFPDYAVFRHQSGKQKWFAAYLPVPAEKIGRKGNETLALLNVKAPSEIIGALRQMPCILPAYHMNKTHWVSIILSEADDELVWHLVQQSFDLTEK